MQCYGTPFLALKVNLSPYCSFVLCSFSPSPSVVFLVIKKKCEMPRRKPLNDSLAKTELFREVDVTGAAKGVLSQPFRITLAQREMYKGSL